MIQLLIHYVGTAMLDRDLTAARLVSVREIEMETETAEMAAAPGRRFLDAETGTKTPPPRSGI